jgi:hypothetical protein
MLSISLTLWASLTGNSRWMNEATCICTRCMAVASSTFVGYCSSLPPIPVHRTEQQTDAKPEQATRNEEYAPTTQPNALILAMQY